MGKINIYDRKMFKNIVISDEVKQIMVDLNNKYPKLSTNYNMLGHLYRLIYFGVDDIYTKFGTYIDIGHIRRANHDIGTYILLYGEIIGKQLYEKYCDDMSVSQKESYKHKDRPNRLSPLVEETWINRGYTPTDAKQKVKHIKSIAQSRSGLTKKTNLTLMPNQLGYWLKKGYSEHEALQFVRDRQHTCKTRKSGILCSSLEIDLYDKLSTIFGSNKIENQKPLARDNGKVYIYDICIDNKIIEFNGDYWHANPQKYDSDWVHPIKHKKAYDIWDDDINKINTAKNQGYDVLVVWENDYLNDPERVVNECIKFVNQ